MELVIWIGTGLAVLGLAGLIWCIVLAMKARNSGLPEDAVRQALQKVVVLNMAALGISAMGLMLVVAGILLS